MSKAMQHQPHHQLGLEQQQQHQQAAGMDHQAHQVEHQQHQSQEGIVHANNFFGRDPVDAGAENGLAALRDSPPGTKPFYPYSTLIRYAIKGAPGQKLLLEDIYMAIESRFDFFRTAPTGWKNSIRHNLSLNPCFEKIARPLTDRGKGAYWTVNDSIDPRAGVHRVRKKKPRGPTVNGKQTQAEHDRQMAEVAAANGSYPPGAIIYPSGHDRGEGSSTGVFMTNRLPISPYPYEHAVRFPTTDESLEVMPLSPELDEEGNPNWRSIWLNELLKLQHATAEQERSAQDPEWYRAMNDRLRIAFSPLPPQQAEYAEEDEQE